MEKKKLICGLIVVGVFLWVTPSIGQVSVTCPGQSLQTAINSNPSGTTFNVTGTCNENIVIFEGKGGITLNGGGTAIINGTIATSATVIILERLLTTRTASAWRTI